jgi:hypothetical protein
MHCVHLNSNNLNVYAVQKIAGLTCEYFRYLLLIDHTCSTRAWLKCGTVGFLLQMSNSDVLTAVTGGVPDVPTMTFQMSGIVQPPGDMSRNSHPNFCLFSLLLFAIPFPWKLTVLMNFILFEREICLLYFKIQYCHLKDKLQAQELFHI